VKFVQSALKVTEEELEVEDLDLSMLLLANLP